METRYDHLPTSYQVGQVTVCPNIILAPMAGVTDSIFRRLVLSLGGCGLVSTEMTNANSLSPKALKRHRQLDYLPEERPLVMQISGNEPDLVARAAMIVEQLGADIVDVNCGCPSPKVTGGGHGSALLKDLPKMGRLLASVRAAVQIPVTLKFRAGWDENSLNYLQAARVAEDAGVSAIALHPRTKAQGYAGSADWQRVAEVRQVVGIPVIGSGDVCDAADALRRLDESGADGVMIGRGAMSNPWIFRQIQQLRAGLPVYQPSPADKYDLLARYVAMCLEVMDERQAIGKLKQLIGQFAVGLPGSARLRSCVHRAQTMDEAMGQLEHFFEHYRSDATVALGLTTAPL